MSEILTSDRGVVMLENCPGYYQTSTVFKFYLQAVGSELDKFKAGVQDVLDQFFVNSADWSLDKWEEELGIETVAGKDIAERRSKIISKLRGMGTVTFNMMKSVANSFENGTVEVEDHPETYSFIVRFVDVLGIPPNLNDLQEAIEEIKPAHLAVTYEFNYTTWGEVNSAGKTWGELNALGLTWGQIMTWKVT